LAESRSRVSGAPEDIDCFKAAGAGTPDSPRTATN
jgi:hypothetical protein